MDDSLALSHLFVNKHPLEAARVLERQSLTDLQEFFRTGSPDIFSQSLKFMPPILACSILENMPPDSSARVLSQLPLENTLLILKQIKKEVATDIQKKLPAPFLKHLKKKLSFPEKTAGFIMNPQIMTLPLDYTVEQASRMIKKYSEYISYYIFAVDREQKFKGYLITRQLMVAQKHDTVGDLVMPFPERFNPYSTYREILKFPGWSDKHAIPVVDKDGCLLGAISYQNFKQIEKLVSQSTEDQAFDDVERWSREVFTAGLVGVVRAFFTAFSSLRNIGIK